jgi:hypothetical protein
MFSEADKFFSRKSICGVTIVILALQYASFLNFNFVEADFRRLYEAKYYVSLYNVFVDQFFNGFFYRPLTNGLLFKIFYDLAGLNSAYYRSFILLIFFFNTLLVYELTLLLCHEKYMAWCAAVFFVTRTALAREVLCISCGFEDPIANFFILSSFVAYLWYSKNHAIGLYIAALLSAMLGILSRESAMVIPLIILLIECSSLNGLNVRHVTKALIKVIPFSLVAACPLIRMVLDTHFSRTRALFYGPSFSLHCFLDNLYFSFLHFFNNSFEMYAAVIFLVVAFGRTRLDAKGIRQLAYACGIIIIGLMPYISLSTGLSAYYLSVSLIGISVLFALGIKNIAERFPVVRSALLVSLVPFFVVSFIIGLKTTTELDNMYKCEKISTQAIGVFKREFPTLPDESFVYIENCDQDIMWALQNKHALRFIYNNTLSIYFEAVSMRKALPEHCSGIYVFSYENKQVHFKKYIAGADLQRFLKEKRL